jgi:uncharacterized membrane protein
LQIDTKSGSTFLKETIILLSITKPFTRWLRSRFVWALIITGAMKVAELTVLAGILILTPVIGYCPKHATEQKVMSENRIRFM